MPAQIQVGEAAQRLPGYLDPVQRKHADLIDMLHVSSRTYYRLRTEAISIMSIRLWSAPSGDIDDWLEVLTLMENI